ncbi:MAG TPA: MlaD family protein [Burkholderiaceae bacterium]|nr:MlaD family protein [Burkholderiaceae bacterium]
MEPRANHVLIGLFTLLAAIAVVGFALWLAKAHQRGQVQHYLVVFNEPVRGLSRGSAVLYNGIRIGEVEDLRLNPEDLRVAHARIAIDASIPVRQDTQARLILTGITGISVIELSGGSPLSPLLMEPDDDSDPVIVATPSPLTQLLAGGDHLMSSISELVLSARSVLSPENIESISHTLSNVEALTAGLAEQRDGVQALLATMTEAGEQAGQTMQHVSELVAALNRLLSEQGGSTLEHARHAMASLEEASTALSRVITENEGAVASGMRGLNDLGPALQTMRETLLSIQRIARRLEDNPGGYLLGREKLQEFEP